MEEDEICVMCFTYGGGEKYRSLTGKLGEKEIPAYSRYLTYTTLVCRYRTPFSVVTGFLLPDGCSSTDGITAWTFFLWLPRLRG